MLNLLFKRRINASVFSSRLFDEKSFYAVFEKDLKRARKIVVIESPFLTVRRSRQLAKIIAKRTKNSVEVIIYTREPSHHPPRLRNQSIESVYILRGAGARVFACSDYRHRKVAVIDKKTLWEGSLNILSQSKSRETMRRIESPQLARQMLAIIKS